jgi:hypothetical protein
MTVGTVFTLFVVPVFYSLIAADHQVKQATATEPAQTGLLVEEAAHA